MDEIPGCGAGGWTLVMKVDGTKNTFNYPSSYWTNREAYKIDDGLEGLTKKEAKLASYWNTPFNKICLGMNVKGVKGSTKWIVINHKASSLFDVIADETYKETNITRAKWKSLIAASQLYNHCSKEGFNIYEPASSPRKIRLRIGLVTSSDLKCELVERFNSCIGFGAFINGCLGKEKKIACGNLLACRISQTNTPAFGYILVQ
ncbi:uncharacterized skeletal organic matrix protein 5-like [Dendronephthya gigantea]|uniref:uncharacterized skeletal organic matrix protein 5-like n=1 Tax=Dendronephthya gigantea TaxID=151771 RepID=UPI00106CBB05|nr:uncharacterized skeletal organic matrix protein 5-like [Dendronephthya gigantea]